MNASAAALAAGDDEFAAAGIERAECDTVACSRVADAPANLECRLTQIVTLPGAANFVVFGEVTGVHLRDDCLIDGRFDVTTFQPLPALDTATTRASPRCSALPARARPERC